MSPIAFRQMLRCKYNRMSIRTVSPAICKRALPTYPVPLHFVRVRPGRSPDRKQTAFPITGDSNKSRRETYELIKWEHLSARLLGTISKHPGDVRGAKIMMHKIYLLMLSAVLDKKSAIRILGSTAIHYGIFEWYQNKAQEWYIWWTNRQRKLGLPVPEDPDDYAFFTPEQFIEQLE